MAAAAVLSAIAAPAAARPVYVYAKPGVGREPMQAAGSACWSQATGHRAPGAPVLPQANLAATAGAALATGFLEGLAEAKARLASMDRCMRAQGFGRLELNPDEATAWRAAKDLPARNAWLDAFLARDWNERIAQALIPAAAPMQPAKAEAFVVGGVRLDPAKLTLASTPVAQGQPVLTGVAEHRRTAVLKHDFQIGKLLDMRAEAGAVFHEVSYASKPQGGLSGDTEWCGPVANNSIRGRVTQPNCITADFTGYQVIVPSRAETWLEGNGHPMLQPDLVKNQTLDLEVSDKDLAGPLDVSLKVDRIAKAGVQLEAVAQRGKDRVTFWDGFVRWDAAGVAVVPFWDRTLRLTRTGNTVTAQLSTDGDGRGWLELDPKG